MAPLRRLRRLFLIFSIWVSTIATTQPMPPPPPLRCNQTRCTLSNSYGVWGDRTSCHFPATVFPTTEEELRQAVANATRNNLKIKVVTKFSHSIPKLACPDSISMAISTENYNSEIKVDAQNLAVTADSGVGLRALINAVEEKGLSLAAAPYWEGVSVGGMISSGSHGSSWWGNGGAVHDHVVGLSLVVPAKESQGFAKVIRLGAQHPLLNAAKVSLGVLGVISKVTFSLEQGFKRSIAYNFTDDSAIENEFWDHGRKHEFADIAWYPSRHTAIYRYDDRVPLNATGDGVNDFLGFQSNSILVSESIRAADMPDLSLRYGIIGFAITWSEKTMEDTRNVKGKCTLASSFLAYKKLVANGLKNNIIFTGYPVIGRQGRMQTSGSCLYSPPARIDTSCSWDPRIKGLFFYETTAIFPASKFADFMIDVKSLRDLNPENFCGVDIYNGFLIRFIKASKAYLGQSEDSVVVDFNYYRSDEQSSPRLNQDVWEEVEQMAFFKHGAKPHWAKNRNLAFLDVRNKYPNCSKFVAAKKQLDPLNAFSSEWSDDLLFGKDGNRGNGCALEGQCVCSEDRHCSPERGYFCRPGLVYKEARVCRHRANDASSEA